MESALTEAVIGSAFEVANVPGAGFLEKVQERALLRELALRGISARSLDWTAGAVQDGKAQLAADEHRGTPISKDGTYLCLSVAQDALMGSSSAASGLRTKTSGFQPHHVRGLLFLRKSPKNPHSRGTDRRIVMDLGSESAVGADSPCAGLTPGGGGRRELETG